MKRRHAKADHQRSMTSMDVLLGILTVADRIKFLIRDRDTLYPPAFDALLTDAGIRTARSSIRTPRMNSIRERWIGGCRRELLDRTLVWNLPHLRSILRQYEKHHNGHRPHMILHSAAPTKPLPSEVTDLQAFLARRHDRIGGIVHEHRQAQTNIRHSQLGVALPLPWRISQTCVYDE
jgi:hypothetical protein